MTADMGDEFREMRAEKKAEALRPPVKAISLWEPWATLVAIGAKRNETRSWPAPKSLIGQDLIICAALRRAPLHEDVPDMLVRDRIEQALRRSPGLCLGHGKALCLVTVTGCERTDDARKGLSEDELAFGNYAPGRFAWRLTNLRRFKFPARITGRHGIFELMLSPFQSVIEDAP